MEMRKVLDSNLDKIERAREVLFNLRFALYSELARIAPFINTLDLDECEQTALNFSCYVQNTIKQLKELHPQLVEPVVDKPDPPEKCPWCGSALVKKKGRFGEFLSCTRYPACHFGWSERWQNTRPGSALNDSSGVV